MVDKTVTGAFFFFQTSDYKHKLEILDYLNVQYDRYCNIINCNKLIDKKSLFKL